MMLDIEIFQREIMMLDFDLTFQTNNVRSDLLLKKFVGSC